MISPFGVDHGGISKADNHKKAAVAGGAGVVGAGVLAGTKMPEHSHYDQKTRKYLHTLPAGEHEVPTKMLATRPRKLGSRKQQTSYVAAMSRERPKASFDASPVPITRYKRGQVIQRDNAHSVMANAMTGRTTRIKIEDAPGHRPTRRTGEELVRRGQMKYQERRLKRSFDIGDKKINEHIKAYKQSSRDSNTAKRPHGVVEDQLKFNPRKYGVKAALGIKRAKNIAMVAKKDGRHDFTAGAAGAAGAGALAATPVRRSATKAKISNGTMKTSDAKKIVSPGYRPGNKKAIRTMAANMGHLENSKTTVIQYKDKSVIPFDGNHRATARIARGDKKIPVKVVQGGERPAVSVARNAYHGAQQKVHQNRMKRGVFNPTAKIGRHAGQSATYSRMANFSPARSGSRVAIDASRHAQGPTKLMLRTKQGAAIGTGAALLGTAEHLHRKSR